MAFRLTRIVDYAFEKIAKDMGYPPLFLLDLRPIERNPICVIRSHFVAEQITRATKTSPYSAPKSPTMTELMPLIGTHSIISAQGEKWKGLRRTFNAGFAPQYLIKLLPRILDKTTSFLDILDGLVRTGAEFELGELTMNLTFDIIGAVTMDEDFAAQTDNPHPIVSRFAALVKSFTRPGWQSIPWNPITKRRRKRASAAVAEVIKANVREKFVEVKRMREEGKMRARSVLALSLQDSQELDAYTLDVVTHQLQSFLFAGHDTTAITLEWALYELSRTPHALAALRAELDQVLGPDSSIEAVTATLRERGEELIGKLPFTSAVIKETLRLYPPAGTARFYEPGTGLVVDMGDGKTICLDGLVSYIAHSLVHRDPAVYGANANEFVPERWFMSGDVNTASEEHTHADNSVAGNKDKEIPASAWRPFERGPRNCIGQELANLEARVILACTVRRYDFEKVGDGALEIGTDGKPVFKAGKETYKVKDKEVFNVSGSVLETNHSYKPDNRCDKLRASLLTG